MGDHAEDDMRLRVPSNPLCRVGTGPGFRCAIARKILNESFDLHACLLVEVSCLAGSVWNRNYFCTSESTVDVGIDSDLIRSNARDNGLLDFLAANDPQLHA